MGFRRSYVVIVLIGAALPLIPLSLYGDPICDASPVPPGVTDVPLSGVVVTTLGAGLVFAVGSAAALAGLPILIAGAGLALLTYAGRSLNVS